MRMVDHKELDYALPESQYFRVVNRYARTVRNRSHAGHNYPSALVMFVFKLFHSALPAGAYRMHRGMPAEIRYIEAQGEACMEHVVPILNGIRLIIYINSRHCSFPRTAFFVNVPDKIVPEYFKRTLKRFHRTGREGAKGFIQPQRISMLLQDLQVS